jgi:hypothetical protein
MNEPREELAMAPGLRGWRPRTAAGGGRPQAGLEFVEKVLTDSMVALLDGAEREHGTRVLLVASLVELAIGPGCASSWTSSPLPRSGPAKLLGCDLD